MPESASAATASSGAGEDTAAVQGGGPAVGRVEHRSHAADAGTRDYDLFVPAGYRGQRVPLIVMLHGGEQRSAEFAAGTRMNELAEEFVFLVAYPEQSRDANRDGLWNWFRSGDQRQGAGEPSIIAGITEEIARDFVVDAGSVFVAGLSAGGAMATIMAVAYPDLFAAAGVHSGLAYGSASDVGSAIMAMMTGGTATEGATLPLIIFHGDNDPIVAVANAEKMLTAQLSQSGLPARKADRAAIGVRVEIEGARPHTRTVHVDPEGRVVVEVWIVHGGGHAWFGGSEGGRHTDPQGPDASTQMVRFFLDSRTTGRR